MNLDKIYFYGKERIEYRRKHFKDYKLRFSLVQAGSKKKVVKWIDEDEFLNFERLKELVDTKMIASIDSTLLPNEIVLESDIEGQNTSFSVFNLTRKILQKLKLKYIMVFSGNKSVHFHIFLKEYDINKLRRIKNALYNYLKEKIPSLDPFGFKENHPYRLPFSLHPETLKTAEILLDDYSSKYFNNKMIVESEVPEQILKMLNKQEEEIIIVSRTNKKSKLYELYKEILQTKIDDGRDRVALILFTVASFLNISKEEFERDFKFWAERNEWKEYRVRWFIEAYKEKEKYYWNKNWRWAIKQFLQSSDIETESYNKIKDIILNKLEWAKKYLIIKNNG